MAALGARFSQRAYPIPFETGRLLRVGAAGAAAYALSLLAPAALWPALLTKLGAVATFPALLWAMGLFRSLSEPGTDEPEHV